MESLLVFVVLLFEFTFKFIYNYKLHYFKDKLKNFMKILYELNIL